MTIDDKLFQEAREHFWTEYHERIEKHGFQLSRDGSMRGEEGISILAIIQPPYSHRDLKKIKKIIPKEYVYHGEKIRVYIFPSMLNLADKFSI